MLKTIITAVVTALSIMLSPGAWSDNIFSGKVKPNSFWLPDQVDLGPLRDHDKTSNPYGDDFGYAKAFASVDMNALKADIEKALGNSQDW